MKAPYRPVVALAEKLACGHFVVIKRTDGWGGRTAVMAHSKRRCADCLSGEAEVSRETVAKLEATLQRVDRVAQLVEQFCRTKAEVKD